MHSNIFALSEYKPCLAISYDYKTDGIMQLVSMEEYVIDINNITFAEMKTKFEKLVNNSDVINELIPSVNMVKEMAKKNFIMLKELI